MASWSRNLRSLIGSLARLCTWRNMTGARLENELIRWDANEREESGGAWQRALAGESPGCRVMSDFIFKGLTQRDDELITSVGGDAVALCDAAWLYLVISFVKSQSLQRIVQEQPLQDLDNIILYNIQTHLHTICGFSWR